MDMCHMLINIKTIDWMQQFGFDIVTLPSHTYHALQPLDVSCFKPFKTTLGKKR